MNIDESETCIIAIEKAIKGAIELSKKELFGKTKKEKKFRRSKAWWTKGHGRLLESRNFTSTRLYELELESVRVGQSRRKVIKKKLKFYTLARNIISKKFKKAIKFSKKTLKKIERQKMIENFLRNPEIFWKQVTNKRGARVSVDLNLELLKEAYEKNFTVIDKSPESEEIEIKMQKIVENYTKLISTKKSKFKVERNKIYDILHKLKNNKTGGFNGLTNEMFKYGRETLLTEIIANLFESIIRGGFFPKNLNIGLICTIIKDPTLSNQALDNTRPITLSEVLSIVLEIFILESLLKGGSLHRHQFGFRRNSSCMHAVFSIKEIMADIENRKTNGYAVYLDFSKAFDKVNRIKLLYILIRSTDPNMWLLIKLYYENLVLYVKDKDGNMSTSFYATVGVKQGGNMTPWLFNKYINNLIEKLDVSQKIYELNGVPKGVMVYADDTNVIAHTINDLRYCIILIERYCSLYDIAINAKKTKWMLFGEPRSIIQEEVKVNGSVIEKVTSFKFLGVIIAQDGSCKDHLLKRRSMFMAGLGEVQRLGFNRSDIPVKMKTLLYTSLVRSKLIYGLETIKMSRTCTKKYLSTLEGNCLKIACGLNTRSRTTTLLYGMGITPIGVYIYKRKVCFILQLINNRATNELISNGYHDSLGDILETIGIREEMKDLGPESYRDEIKLACVDKLRELEEVEKEIKSTALVAAIEYLLRHRGVDNDDTLQYLLDPRRGSRG
jgi:hypothetical protein